MSAATFEERLAAFEARFDARLNEQQRQHDEHCAKLERERDEYKKLTLILQEQAPTSSVAPCFRRRPQLRIAPKLYSSASAPSLTRLTERIQRAATVTVGAAMTRVKAANAVA